MRAAVVTDASVRVLDGRGDAPVVITPEEVQRPDVLARLLNELRRGQAETARRWNPRVLVVEDRDLTSGDEWRVEHGFGGRVRWWIADWQPSTPGDVPVFERDAATDANALVLDVGNSGRATLIVMEAG